MTEPTVYINEDGDLWVAVEDAPYALARRAAKRLAEEEWSQGIVYRGKETVRLTEHEFDCYCPTNCGRDRLAWHFEGTR